MNILHPLVRRPFRAAKPGHCRNGGGERGASVGDKTLIGFLRAGLIDVGGNDAKLALLEEAVVDLADILTSTPSKVLPFALVAFDPNAPANDPVIKEVADTVEARWATYVNTFSTTRRAFSGPAPGRSGPRRDR